MSYLIGYRLIGSFINQAQDEGVKCAEFILRVASKMIDVPSDFSQWPLHISCGYYAIKYSVPLVTFIATSFSTMSHTLIFAIILTVKRAWKVLQLQINRREASFDKVKCMLKN